MSLKSLFAATLAFHNGDHFRRGADTVTDEVTIADLRADKLPGAIDRIADDPDAWLTR